MNHMSPASLRPLSRDLHFDLKWVGPAHETEAYTLHIGGRRYPLVRHTGETLASGSPTHVAKHVAVKTDTPQLLRVTGPNNPDGFPTLASVAIHTADDAGSYSTDDVAKAIVFMNPTLTMLTTASAQTVLGHIASNNNIQPLSDVIAFMGSQWCQPVGVVDDARKPVWKHGGAQQFYTYELDPEVINTSAAPSRQSKALIYSDASLQGTRWELLPGVSVLDMNTENGAAHRAAKPTGPADTRMSGNADGYHVALQDGGPNYGVSVKVNSLSGAGSNLTIDLTVTNSYIRHTSVFVSFLEADGVTPMKVTDQGWLALLANGPAWPLVDECLNFFESDKPAWLGGDILKFLGKVGAESTFLGVPVSSANVDFQFGLPQDAHGPVGKIRLLVGSLGVSSGNDSDPTAAWFGLSLTAMIDLAIPTFALLLTAGVETNVIFDKMFKDVNLLLPIAGSVYTSVSDLFTDPSKVGKDISALVLTLSNALIKSVLTKPDILAALAGYFGLEEAEEAIPFVGWGFKMIAMEATVLQLGQTVGEVVGSPRVVEFDLTVTMDACITLVPDGEFPQTARTYTITAQYHRKHHAYLHRQHARSEGRPHRRELERRARGRQGQLRGGDVRWRGMGRRQGPGGPIREPARSTPDLHSLGDCEAGALSVDRRHHIPPQPTAPIQRGPRGIQVGTGNAGTDADERGPGHGSWRRVGRTGQHHAERRSRRAGVRLGGIGVGHAATSWRRRRRRP